jgi:hypothetical protein
MIYLYLKTHNVTGLKYLGKTTKDPYTYNGSGKKWSYHLKVHGCDISTLVLFCTEDKEKFKNVALKVSKSLNIVESPEFANLTYEEGQGGNTWCKKGRPFLTEEQLKKRTERHLKYGHPRGKKCKIDGVVYLSTRRAEEELKIHHTTISYRCRSKNFHNYQYLN